MEEHTNLLSKWSSMKTYIQVTWCRLTELYLGTYMYMNAAIIIKKKVMYLKKSKEGNYRTVWREERHRRNDKIMLYPQNIKNNIEEKFKK